MNNPEKPLRSPDETTVLHFNKFTAGHEETPAEEGATMFIKRAAAETVQQSVAPVVVPKAAAPLHAEEMLGAIAYCYAKGVYSSSDIERKMLQDSEFREALGGVVPDPGTIRRFRRLNRQAIQTVLEQFYRRLRQRKPPTEALPGATPPEPSPLPSAPEPQPGDNTAFFVRREATDRLDKATFIDGMSSDS
jgi:hypothetical protein